MSSSAGGGRGSAIGRCARAAPRLGGDYRPRVARRAWRLGNRRRSRRGVVPEQCAARLGAISLRALALDRARGAGPGSTTCPGVSRPSHYGRWAEVGDPTRSRAELALAGAGSRESASTNRPLCPPRSLFSAPPGWGSAIPMRSAPRWRGFRSRRARLIGRASPIDPDAIRRLNAGAVADPAAIGPARKDEPPADIVTGQYRNRRHASVVPRPVFVDGKPVADAVIELPARRLENAPLLAGSPGIDPTGTTPPVKGRGRIGQPWRGREFGQGPRRAHPYRQMARAQKNRLPEARVRGNGLCPREARNGAHPAGSHAGAIAGPL